MTDILQTTFYKHILDRKLSYFDADCAIALTIVPNLNCRCVVLRQVLAWYGAEAKPNPSTNDDWLRNVKEHNEYLRLSHEYFKFWIYGNVKEVACMFGEIR